MDEVVTVKIHKRIILKSQYEFLQDYKFYLRF